MPKCCCQSRLTITRAVSGLSFEAIQFGERGAAAGLVADGLHLGVAVRRCREEPGREFFLGRLPPVAALEQMRGRRASARSVIAIATRRLGGLVLARARRASPSAGPTAPSRPASSTSRHPAAGIHLLLDHRRELLFQRRALARPARRADERIPPGSGWRWRMRSLSRYGLLDLLDRGPHFGGLRLPTLRGTSSYFAALLWRESAAHRPATSRRKTPGGGSSRAARSGRSCGRGSGSSRA